MSHGPGETLLTGTTADKVKAAALAADPGATIIRVETDSAGSPYEAHITKADGTQVTLKIDANFKVTSTEQGFGAGPGGQAPPTGSAPGRGVRGRGEPRRGTASGAVRRADSPFRRRADVAPTAAVGPNRRPLGTPAPPSFVDRDGGAGVDVSVAGGGKRRVKRRARSRGVRRAPSGGGSRPRSGGTRPAPARRS